MVSVTRRRLHPHRACRSNGSADEIDDNVCAIDDLSDEASSREGDEPEYFPSMARDDLSDQDGYMADPASDVDSPRSAHMAIDDMSDGDGPMSPVSSDGRVRPTKARPNLYDLLRQIESSDDGVSKRVAQAACDSDTSGSPTMPSTTRTGRTRRCRCIANL